MKVTIASPICNRAEYLPSYLEAILSQTYPKEQINLYFLINNCYDNSKQILENFKSDHSNKYPKIQISVLNNYSIPNNPQDRQLRITNNKIYKHLANIRNNILKAINTEFLFSVDSDIMLKKDTLEKLMNHNKKCISALVCNGQTFFDNTNGTINKYKYTNTMYEIIPGKYRHTRLSELKGLIEVDITGAVYLIHKSIYKNCQYKECDQGEDIPFCQDVKKMKEKIYCDTDLKLPHCMTLDLLEQYKSGNFLY